MRAAAPARLAQRGEMARRPLPAVERRVEVSRALAADPRSSWSTRPGGARGRRAGGRAEPPRGRRRRAARQSAIERAARRGRGERRRAPRPRPGSPSAPRTLRDQRPAASRVAQDDRDLVGLDPSASRRAISAPIASASPSSPAASISARPSSGATGPALGLEQAASRWRSVALGVGRVERQRLETRRPSSSRSRASELGARRERVAVRVVDGEETSRRRRGPRSARAGFGEVVEAVDEQRAARPRRPGSARSAAIAAAWRARSAATGARRGARRSAA